MVMAGNGRKLVAVGVLVLVLVAYFALRRTVGFSPEEVILLPRNKRNKNPLNVRPLNLPEVWQGQVGLDEGENGPYCIYDAMWRGWRNGGVNLLNYNKRHHLDTVLGIVTRWAPAKDKNKPAEYAAAVAADLGLLPTQSFNVRARLSDLMLAMARQEGGAWADYDLEREAGANAAKAYVK